MPSLAQIYSTIGHALGDMSVPMLASGGTTASGSIPPTVIISAMVSGANAASIHFQDAAWIYNQTQRLSRKVRSGGYAPLTGTFTVDPNWTVPLAGDNMILTRLFPIQAQVLTRETSYYDIANEAARWLWFEHQLALPTVRGQHSYPLTSYGRWLTSREQFLGLLDPPLVAGYPPQRGDWRRPTLEFQAGVPTLRLRTAYDGVGEQLLLGVRCPLSEAVTGADPIDGLQVDTDTVNGDLAELETVGLWIAYRTLAQGNGPDAAVWAAKEGPQEARARALAHFYDRGPVAAPATPATATPAVPTPRLAASASMGG